MADLTAREARRLDLNAEELGVPVSRLMDQAGRALARAVARQVKRGGAVAILCGKGNNGGDGFAAAAHLRRAGIRAYVVLAESSAALRSPAARQHWAAVQGEDVHRWPDRGAWRQARVLVDCLLGSGLSGAPRAPYAAIIAWLNRRRAAGIPVIACDVPSGFGTPLVVRPTQTVTFHARKVGMDASCGRIIVAPIGIPRATIQVGLGDLDAGYRRPAHNSHKGDNGAVLVVAGSLPLVGAAHYVAQGALRTGADLVHVATAQGAATVLRTWGPHPIVHAANAGDHLTTEGLATVESLLPHCDALVIGPGLGTRPATRLAARAILEAAGTAGMPVVVDADALDALDADLLRRFGPQLLLTPHAREFQDLAGRVATRANVVAYARRTGATVLSKGATDVIASADQVRECKRGHPTLTVGGTGDVLAGIAGALLAKGATPFDAACAASYLLKSAGEVAASLRSYGATASDVAEAVPSILLRLP